MWKAEKIELTKNSETYDDLDYFYNRRSLLINSVLICNHVTEGLNISSPNNFQDGICTYCGEPGCNAGGMLCIRRHDKSLWFIPCFHYMESYLEYDCSDEHDTGDSESPPHEWYERGILEIDEDKLPEFLELMKGFNLQEIPFISTKEMEKVLEWEKLVKEKPVGFMRKQNLEI